MNATKTKTETEAEAAAEAGAETLADELVALKAQITRLASRIHVEDAPGLARARELADDLSQEWRRVEGDIRAATRERPWRSLAMAGLVGFVIGLILRR